MIKKKKKILFIHHAASWGGAPNSLIKLINSLDKRRYDVTVLLLKNSIVADKLTENGIKYFVANSIFYKRHYHYFTHSEAGHIKWFQIYSFIKLSVLWLLSRFYFSKKELEKHDFDIVHLNSSVLTDWLAPAAQKGKVVIHIREPYRKGRFDILHYLFTRQMRQYANIIIAISIDNAKRIGIPEKTTVIYNYTDALDKYIDNNSYYSKKILYLGGNSYIKGFYTMVQALDYLDNDIKVYFGGSYEIKSSPKNGLKKIFKSVLGYGKKRQRAIDKMKTHPNALEIGMVYNVPKYIGEVCCLVSPFAVAHFSRPIIEAFARQKCVIATKVEGMQEVVKHNYNGLLVEVNDPKELANAINYLANRPDLCRQFGQNGYIEAEKNFSSKNILLIEKVYSNLST